MAAEKTKIEKREPYNPLLKSYPDSERVNAVSIGAETLFTRLIAKADDADHYYGDEGMVLGKLFTRRMCAGQVTTKVIREWIAELERAGLIVTYSADSRQYLEIVNRRKDLRADVKPDIRFPQRDPNASGPDSARTRDGNGASTQPNPTEPNPPPVLAGASDLPAGFVRFWQAWPRHFRKQGRSQCVKHWKKQKLEPLADQVVAALQRCKASHDWTKEGGAFIPFPMSWLNKTPWETDDADLMSTIAPAPQKDWG